MTTFIFLHMPSPSLLLHWYSLPGSHRYDPPEMSFPGSPPALTGDPHVFNLTAAPLTTILDTPSPLNGLSNSFRRIPEI